jgi:translocation protein SEC62
MRAMQAHQKQMEAQQQGQASPQGEGQQQQQQEGQQNQHAQQSAPQQQVQQQTHQVPVQPGQPADPKALAVANFLRSQNLKPRTCILDGQRKDMFKGMSRHAKAKEGKKREKKLPSIGRRSPQIIKSKMCTYVPLLSQ